MRDFSWQYFAMTGDVDAYLLYRESDGNNGFSDEESAAAEEQIIQEEQPK